MNTSSERVGFLVLRFAIAAVFVAHAALKLLVYTLPGTAAFFRDHGIPGWTAYPVFAVELVGAALMGAGVAVRWTSFLLAAVMVGAIYVHAPNGWGFTSPGGGWEYPAFLFAVLIALGLTHPRRAAAATVALVAATLGFSLFSQCPSQPFLSRDSASGHQTFPNTSGQARGSGTLLGRFPLHGAICWSTVGSTGGGDHVVLVAASVSASWSGTTVLI